MTYALNISKMLESALKQGLIDAGVDESKTFLNFWQVSNPRTAFFPQITAACSPDIPQGTGTSAFSEFRLLHCQMRAVTAVDADEDRAAIAALYVQIRTMLDAANAQRAAWQTTSLVGCVLDAVTITDSPVPYVEQLANGAWAYVMDVNFDCHVSVT